MTEPTPHKLSGEGYGELIKRLDAYADPEDGGVRGLCAEVATAIKALQARVGELETLAAAVIQRWDAGHPFSITGMDQAIINLRAARSSADHRRYAEAMA